MKERRNVNEDQGMWRRDKECEGGQDKEHEGEIRNVEGQGA